MKKWLQTLAGIALLSINTLTHADPALGTWESKVYDDVTGGLASTVSVCIQSGGNWYFSAGAGIAGWQGKWFSKGNDIHLQALHSSGTAAASYDVVRVNSGLLAGYYKWIGNNGVGTAGYYTASLTYKKSTCAPYIP